MVKVDSPPERVTRFWPPTLVGSVVCGSVYASATVAVDGALL
jgi:hypothetical protein